MSEANREKGRDEGLGEERLKVKEIATFAYNDVHVFL
jgi:hypothetical protein